MFLNAVKFARKYDNSKNPGYSLKIKEIKLQVWGKCGIITSDLKSAGSGFCRAKARLAEHRTSENILPLNLLSDDKIRRTAVSVYTDLIYGIITSDLKSAGSGFCRAKARLAEHRTSENILPLNLLSDDKIRRTAVSVYTDLIYGIIIYSFRKSLFPTLTSKSHYKNYIGFPTARQA